MQLQKQELKDDIISIAEKEFAKRGFKSTSMRVIAKKSNTTLGNLYNYFDSKEDILSEVIGTTIEDIEKIFDEHIETNIEVDNFETMNEELAKCDLNKLGYNIFLSNKFIILMEGIDGTRYEGYRDKFLNKCKEHFLWHLDNREGNNNFIEIIANSFLNGILFIAKRNDDISHAKNDFIKLYQLICSGMVSQFKLRDDINDKSK